MTIILKTEGLNKIYRQGGLVRSRQIKALNDARGAYVKNIRSKEFQP